MGEKKTKRLGPNQKQNQNLDEPHSEIVDRQREEVRGGRDEAKTDQPNPSSPRRPWRRRYDPPPWPPSGRRTDWPGRRRRMATRSDDPPESSSPPPAAAAAGEIWGTLEELLLACAVRRHGTASWESVATAVQSRTRPSAAARLSPNSCRLRYRLLHRRFAAGADEDQDAEPDAAADADAWVEELRKLRVAELRREVERYDLSIGSLKSKVKRLKEERERSLSGEATPASKEGPREAANGSTAEAGGENGVSGEASGRSCKESTSSDLKPPPGHDPGGAPADGEPEVKEEPAAGEVAVKKESSGESVAGSKEADAEKESSDVQSAASPSRRRRRRRLRKVGGGELASASAPVALPAADAEPLLAFLESVRTSKSGSVFERRLESQESAEYRATIRRHVDLEMIRSRLESGGAASGPGSTTCYASASEFYRDLLLLCANALVFFPRGSPEHAAASRTRALVSKRISADLHKGGPGTSGKDAAAGAVVGGGLKKPKADAEVAGSLLEKAAPIIVCRKRSSIAKAAAGKEEKVEKGDTDDGDDEDEGKKGGANDKARGTRTYKARGPAKNSAPNQKTGKVSESAAAAEGTKKSDKKGGSGGKPAAAGGVIKKRNAVDFLKRMKQNSVPSTERVSLLETLKLSAATEQKKAGKGDGRKDPGSSSGSKKSAAATESGSGGRRSVGRPPKRAAAPPTPPPSKRAKEDRPTRKRGGKK
ncbi:hypothetical protein ACQ4PT_040333 [Festuca glaucescens]